MSLTLPAASRQVIKCFLSEHWRGGAGRRRGGGVRIPQSQPGEMRGCSGLLGRTAGRAGLLQGGRVSMVLALDSRTRCPWDSKARVQAVPEVSCPPRTWQPGGGGQQFAGGRGGEKVSGRPAAARLGRMSPSHSKTEGPRSATPAHPLPSPMPPRLPRLPARPWAVATGSNRPSLASRGGGRRGRARAEPLPRGSACCRSTNISLCGGSEGPALGRRPGGCWTRPG